MARLRYNNSFRDTSGDIAAFVYVYIYEDADGTSLSSLMEYDGTPIGNPIATDENGFIDVYITADDGATKYYQTAGMVGTEILPPSGPPRAQVTGARDEPEGALANLLNVLEDLGIIDNSTTAT
jgi:hypothetical protein